MAFIDEIKNRAKKDIKKIVLPESDDDRTLKATSEVLKQKFAEIILIGNRNKILERAKELCLDNIEEAEIVDPNNSEKYDKFVEQFYELRKHKGMTIEKVRCSLGHAFAEGQVYVAISRVKSLEGLFIESFNINNVKANKKVIEFYRKNDLS